MKSSRDIHPRTVDRYREGSEEYKMNATGIQTHGPGGAYEEAWNEGRYEIISLLEEPRTDVSLRDIAVDGHNYLAGKYGSGEEYGIAYVVLVKHKDVARMGMAQDGPDEMVVTMLVNAMLRLGARVSVGAEVAGGPENHDDHQDDAERGPAGVTEAGVTEAAEGPGKK